MYISSGKSIVYSPFERIEKINAISKEVQVKRDRHKLKFSKDTSKKVAEENFSLKKQYPQCERLNFLPPTEVYFNYINSKKELIYGLSINASVYENKEEVLGRNIDIGI